MRVGLAVTDPDRKFAFPLTTYQRRTRDEDAVTALGEALRAWLAG